MFIGQTTSLKISVRKLSGFKLTKIIILNFMSKWNLIWILLSTGFETIFKTYWHNTQ